MVRVIELIIEPEKQQSKGLEYQMEKKTGQVLKSDKIKLEGQFHLNASQAQSYKPRQNNPTRATPQVRILENNPEYAVISITCSCGTETSIRCDYAETHSGDGKSK